MRQEASGVDMQQTPLVNVPDPINDLDAVNKRSAIALAGATSYVHNQSGPASTWNIPHHLGKLYPAITIVDSANDLIIGYQVNAIDINNIQLIFSAAFSGTATLT